MADPVRIPDASGESAILALAARRARREDGHGHGGLPDPRAAGVWLDDALVADVLRRALNEEWRP